MRTPEAAPIRAWVAITFAFTRGPELMYKCVLKVVFVRFGGNEANGIVLQHHSNEDTDSYALLLPIRNWLRFFIPIFLRTNFFLHYKWLGWPSRSFVTWTPVFSVDLLLRRQSLFQLSITGSITWENVSARSDFTFRNWIIGLEDADISESQKNLAQDDYVYSLPNAFRSYFLIWTTIYHLWHLLLPVPHWQQWSCR